nr:MAG TPA_asm: hypothetical protein [Caudoviricetes sp.]
MPEIQVQCDKFQARLTEILLTRDNPLMTNLYHDNNR